MDTSKPEADMTSSDARGEDVYGLPFISKRTWPSWLRYISFLPCYKEDLGLTCKPCKPCKKGSIAEQVDSTEKGCDDGELNPCYEGEVTQI